jgi:AraC-like DNA-binding protein
MSVKEIAAKLKFSSEFHFSKQFKHKTGLAPSYYRANYLQELGNETFLENQ